MSRIHLLVFLSIRSARSIADGASYTPALCHLDLLTYMEPVIVTDEVFHNVRAAV
jgi:hypothetical protein